MSTSLLENRYLEFSLCDQLFAIPLLTVKEVIQKTDVTPVPNMPAYFEGMINLRGQVLGVFELKKRINLKAKESQTQENPKVVIVIEQFGLCVGVIVDNINRVIHTNVDMIQPAPLKADDPGKAYITSVIHDHKSLILIVDMVRLLELDKNKKLGTAA